MNTKLPEKWLIPESLQKRFGTKGIGKQRAMAADGHLLLVLHKLNDELENEAVIFWRNPQGEWQDSLRGKTIYNLRCLIRSFVDKEEELSRFYDKASKPEDYFDLLEILVPMVRTAKNMATTLQQARELQGGAEIIDLRDMTQELSQDLEILYLDSKNAMDYTVAKRAEEQAKYAFKTSKSTEKLNVLVALFLPITAMSGIFGMNMKNGLEEMPVSVFWMMMLGSFFLGLGIKSWLLNEGPEEKEERGSRLL